jgi:hypothetical protein
VIVALMQPYLLPYIGYFQLMDAVDEWVVYDDVQYSKGGWLNRNRVLHPDAGWQYVGVRIRKHPLATPIRDIRLVDRPSCRERMLRQLEHYKRQAPEYHETVDFVDRCFDIDTDLLADLTVHALRLCGARLGIKTRILRSSDMARERCQRDPQDAVIDVCHMRGATTYINTPGGRHLYQVEAFREAGVELRFLKPGLVSYDQGDRDFVPALSIIDVFMWNPAEAVISKLMRYETVSAMDTRADA